MFISTKVGVGALAAMLGGGTAAYVVPQRLPTTADEFVPPNLICDGNVVVAIKKGAKNESSAEATAKFFKAQDCHYE